VKTDLKPIHPIEMLHGCAIMFEVPIAVKTHVTKRSDHRILISGI